jgi:hypothetical protein
MQIARGQCYDLIIMGGKNGEWDSKFLGLLFLITLDF